MDESHTNPGPDRLRGLLREAGIKSFRAGGNGRIAMYGGRFREWSMHFRMNEHWLALSSFVCGLPAETSLRSRVMEHALRENDRLTLVKFTTNGSGLSLDCEYRTEHVTADVVNHLASMFHAILEETYPAIFRIVSGDAVLEELDFKANREAA